MIIMRRLLLRTKTPDTSAQKERAYADTEKDAHAEVHRVSGNEK